MNDQHHAYALELDARDPLREYRDQFLLPLRDGKEQVYFLGNSLGMQPKTTSEHLARVLSQWQHYGVEAFFEGDSPWLDMHERLAAKMAPIAGCKPSEIVVMNHLTVNLHLLMTSFYRPEEKRYRILCEAKAFPSDQYMLESLCKTLGRRPDEVLIELQPSGGDEVLQTKDILQAITTHADELALVFFGGVNYYTGELIDMKQIAAAAKAHGITVGFDLAHAAGNVMLQLHDWNVDFAAWCNYKYLNAGPGAIATAFIHERYHTDTSLSRLAGWWGYDKATRFQMKPGFIPVRTAEGWQVSTPPILLYAALEASLDIFADAGMEMLHAKSSLLFDYLVGLLEQIGAPLRDMFRILTPVTSGSHGCQVSLQFKEHGRAVFAALTEAGIFADWREPGVIRVAPVPLYNRFTEIWKFAQVLEAALLRASDD